MKVCIPSSGRELTSKADPRFGRAPYFVFVEEESPGPPRVYAVENTAAAEARGAGTEAARIALQEGAEVVVSGAVGPHAFEIFEKIGIPVYLMDGDLTVQQAYEEYREGRLQRMVIKRL